MRVDWDLEQRTPEWFETKWGRIGGSTSKGLRVKSDTLMTQLVGERLESYYDNISEGFTSEAMEAGIEREDEAVKLLSERVGVELKKCGWIQSDINLIGLSPDAVSEDLKDAAEVKCPQNKRHTELLLTDEIHLDYVDQIIHYFTVNNILERLHFLSYRPESVVPEFYKLVELDSEVNVGTKSRPRMISIREAAEERRQMARDLETLINSKVEKLTF